MNYIVVCPGHIALFERFEDARWFSVDFGGDLFNLWAFPAPTNRGAKGMHEQRLGRLEALLRRDAANPHGVKFDLASWAEPDDTLKGTDLVALSTFGLKYWNIGEDMSLKPVIPMSCDTHACALGLGALDPEFQAEGLNYTLLPGHSHEACGTMVPTFEGETGFDAGARFFEISNSDARYLFDPDCYDGTPREAEGELFVADRIRDLINGDIDMNHHPDREDDED